MSVLEQLFDSAVLDIVVPDTSVGFPPSVSTDDWLAQLSSAEADRKQAFFDEQLQFFLIVRIVDNTPDVPIDVDHPPAELVTFISHLQVSLEATYISSTPAPHPEVIHSARISTPPRTTSFGPPRSHDSLHPSIFPPTTPNPTPSTADDDRRYSRSEGTLLLAKIWGKNTSDESCEAFSFLWSQREQVWVAVYRLGITVSFLRLSVSNPLLCLTVSSTLREKPIPLTQPRHPLASFLLAHGISQVLEDEASPHSTTDNGALVPDEQSEELTGLEEVNLLEGLGSGPTFSTFGPDRVYLPTTRLGGVTRRRLFSLPPVVPVITQVPSPAPSTARVTHATLRKSFRKTLQTASGFRVRMRTVFVPYVLLSATGDGIELGEEEDEQERREAGNNEHTVVLCVEIENSGESGRRVCFVVEAVDVKIGGEGATATLIGWQDQEADDSKKGIFPLLISSKEQYNLLYAVSFLRAPGDVDGYSLTSRDKGGSTNADLQRAVTINIFGRPFLLSERLSVSDAQNLIAGQSIDGAASSGAVSFPTSTFTSRWNCVLDLSSNQNQRALVDLDADGDDAGVNNNNALPEPASPFPVFSPRTASTMDINSAFPPIQAVAGSRRPTFPETPFVKWSAQTSTPSTSRPSTSFPNRLLPNTTNKSGLTVQYPTTPTTYAPPPTTAGFDQEEYGTPSTAAHDPYAKPPTTPAYPAYPAHSALPPTPISLGPVANQAGSVVGPSVEIRRERGAAMGSVPTPQTPGPTVSNAFSGRGPVQYQRGVDENGQSIIVSIGLSPAARSFGSPPRKETERSRRDAIFPLDQFTLDIFVYNQSERTRRFEVSCPHRRRHKQEGGGTKKSRGISTLGILPLDNRVRIGPLLPATCQSVRMQFLALVPGVHTVNVLTLTDIESGYSINLRSVLDIVVHDRDDLLSVAS